MQTTNLGTVYVALHLIAAVITTALAAFAWRHRNVPGARWFLGLQVVNVAWALTSAAGLTVPAGQRGVRLAWETASLSLSVLIPVLWIAFTFEYTGDVASVTRRRIAALLVVPGVTLANLLLPGDAELLFVDATVTEFAGLTAVSFTPGPWFVVQIAYTFTLFVAGTVVVLRGAWSFDRASRDRAVAVVVGTLVPLVTSMTVAGGAIPVDGLDPTPVTLSVTGVAFGYALFRTQLFELVPATRSLGEAAAIEDLDDGVVIATESGDVLRMNPAARRLVGRPAGAVDDLQSVFEDVDVDPDVLPTRFETATGRTVEVTVSPVTGRREERIGETYLLSDVTDRERREQRLTVLNRVLRHNLRNDLGTLRGYASLLVENADDDRAEVAAVVAETTDDLVDLSEKARQIERLIAREEMPAETVDVAPVVAGVAEFVASEQDGTVDLDVADGVVLDTDPVVLESVVRNLVENAFQHGTDGSEVVEVSVDRTSADVVEVVVADDGPGIRDEQVRVLESGSETPLEHADGLGLWLVQWGATQIGGQVDIESNEPRGTVVTLSLPTGDGSAGRHA